MSIKKDCMNCAHSIKRIDEEPCVKCSHIYDDNWTPIDSALKKAAKIIKTYCNKADCVDCPFHNPGKEPVCSLAPKDDNNIPSTWEV